MNEKYPYGQCHVCHCAISIPGFEAYYCPGCRKWLAYSKTQKVNDPLQTTAKTARRKHSASSPEQPTLSLDGGKS